MVHDRRCGDQGILDQVIGAPVHQRRPGPEDAGIHRKNVPGLRDKIDPALDLRGLLRVLFASGFYVTTSKTVPVGTFRPPPG